MNINRKATYGFGLGFAKKNFTSLKKMPSINNEGEWKIDQFKFNLKFVEGNLDLKSSWIFPIFRGEKIAQVRLQKFLYVSTQLWEFLPMLRAAHLDATGIMHHVIGRGYRKKRDIIKRCATLRFDRSADYFSRRRRCGKRKLLILKHLIMARPETIWANSAVEMEEDSKAGRL
jgi:hypothetical protein